MLRIYRAKYVNNGIRGNLKSEGVQKNKGGGGGKGGQGNFGNVQTQAYFLSKGFPKLWLPT